MSRLLAYSLFAMSLLLPDWAAAQPGTVQQEELPEPEDGGYPEREAEAPVERTDAIPTGDLSADDHDAAWMDEVVLSIFVHVAPAAGFEPHQRLVFTKGLVDELNKLQETNVSTEAPVTSSEDGSTCPKQQTSCLTRLAEGLGANEIVMARTADLGEAKVLTLKRVRIRDASVMGAVTRQMSGSHGEEFLLILGDAVQELYPERPLASGQIRGADPTLVERFNPPGVAPWQFYTAAGATVLAGAATIALGLSTRAAESDFNDYAHRGTTELIEAKVLMKKEQKAEDRALQTNVALGITTALAIGTGVLFFYTDWAGDEGLQAGLTVTDGGFALGIAGGF